MSEQTRAALSEAFDLIEAERLDEARAILKPMLTTHADNPDVWWLYAHAVTDPDTARTALYTVLRLDPSYPNANELVRELEKQAPVTRTGAAAVETEPSFLSDIPSTLPDLPEFDVADEFTDVDLGLEDDEVEELEVEPASRRRLLLLAALGIVAVVAIIAVALLTSRPPEPASPTPTSEVVAGQASATPLAADVTAEATTAVIATEAAPELTPEDSAAPTSTVETTAEVLAVEASPTTENLLPTQSIIEPATGEVTSVSTALTAFDVAESGVQVETTTLGNTLVANICTTAGVELRSTLPAVMDVLARQTLPDNTDAVGTRMVNCDDNSALLFIVVPVDSAADYAAGNLSEEDFQALWKSL